MARFRAFGIALGALLAAENAAAESSARFEPPITKTPVTPVTLDLGATLGVGTRLVDSADYDISSRAGVALGLFGWLAPAPSFAVGLMYQHLGLGHERGDFGSYGTVDIDRSAHLVWAGLRLFPLRSETSALYLEIAPGLVFQHASASGIVGNGGPNVALQPLTCSASESADFGLRAGLGGEVKIAPHVVANIGLTFDNLRFGSDAMGDCVNGSGTVTEILVSAGFAYRIDVSRFVR
jgi:hypothetical protein